jgi:hypothetical protein
MIQVNQHCDLPEHPLPVSHTPRWTAKIVPEFLGFLNALFL